MASNNTQDKQYREVSYIEQQSDEGVLFEVWTTKWGLKVYPWYSMDKLRFSFIEKGAKGKGKSFDVSISTKRNGFFDFESLMHEVLHDIRTPYDFVTVLAKEKEAGEQYPKRYRFITGSNGEKSVGICNSSNGGYCINGKTVKDGKAVFANIPCSYYDIYNIVTAYNETYEARRNELKGLLANGISNLEKRIKDSKEQPDADPEAVLEDENSQSAENAQSKESTPTQIKKPDTDSTEEKSEGKKPNGIKVITASEMTQNTNGDYLVSAKKADGTLIDIRIPQDTAAEVNKNGLFEKFMTKINVKGEVEFTFTGSKKKTKDGNIEYIFAAFC